jgi:hypothetical protein
MKTVHKLLLIVTALVMLCAAGCTQPLDLSMQRNRIFLMGRLLEGKTCDVSVIWRKAPNNETPVTVMADLSKIGGPAEQELTSSDNGTWRWAGQVAPDVAGERLITVTAVDAQNQKTDVSKRFRVFATEKAIAIQAGNGKPSLALMAEGTVVAWDYATGARVDIPAGLTDIAALSADVRGGHFLALKTEGTIAAWGCETDPEHDYGQCDVPAGLSDVVAVAAGVWHSLAVKADGTVVVWGWMDFIPIPAELADVVAVSAGDNAIDLALKADGTVVFLGTADFYYGKDAIAGLRDVIAVAAGTEFTLAVTGRGEIAQIGNNKQIAEKPPVRVGTCRATAVATGFGNNIALQKDGSVVVWAPYYFPGGNYYMLVFHRLKDCIAVGAVSNSSAYLALSESGGVTAWEEAWVRAAMTELPVPQELK